MRRLQKTAGDQKRKTGNVKVYFEIVWKESLKLISLNIKRGKFLFYLEVYFRKTKAFMAKAHFRKKTVLESSSFSGWHSI